MKIQVFSEAGPNCEIRPSQTNSLAELLSDTVFVCDELYRGEPRIRLTKIGQD